MSLDQVVAERIWQFTEEIEPHFDSIVILCTYRGEKGTMVQFAERGNHYATLAVMESFLNGEFLPQIENKDGEE
jgi:hypothetical protein